MKRILLLTACFAALLTACDRNEYEEKTPNDAALYLDAAAERPDVNVFFKRTVETQRRKLSAVLSGPVGHDVTASLAVDASKVDLYNARHGTDLHRFRLPPGMPPLPKPTSISRG